MICALCESSLPHHPILDGEATFCCHGCHAVYQILSAKNLLTDYRHQSVFQHALQAGLISNPSLLSELKARQAEKHTHPLEKWHLEIAEMWCPSCAELIRLVLLQEKGVLSCLVDYSTDLALIEFSPFATSKDRLKARIAALGYSPLPLDAPERAAVSYQLYFRFIIAAFCSLNVMMFAYPLYATYFDFDDQGYGRLFSWLSLVASTPVVTYCAWPIFRRGWSAALVGIIGMEALVSLGVLSAFAFSLLDLFKGGTQVYFDSMTVVIAFVLLGKMIESKAKFSAKSSLMRLYKGVPKKGRKKLESGTWAFVSVKDIHIGETIQVLMGEKIVLDGVIKKGTGTCDESLMTGESLPVSKKVGDRVLAGSLLQNGHLEVEVSSVHEETAFHRILQLCESDINHKSSYSRAVDPWVKAFVPGVLAFAAMVFAAYLTESLEIAVNRMMAVLLISCPCAIGIAAPLAESHLMHALTSLGVVIRNRAVLSSLGRETVYIFDKTGTITHGTFKVLKGMEGMSEEQKSVLKSMTAYSTHPISAAISQALSSSLIEMESIEEFAGKGIRAFKENSVYYLGSRHFLQQHGFSPPATQTLHTTVFFAEGGQLLSVIELGDQIRADAIDALLALHPIRAILLSGDAPAAVGAVALACGFREWHSEATPLRKREVVDELKKQGETVCFVGDGINDAPALTAAHIGISVLSAADISIQVSDILLTTDRLTIFPRVSRLAKKAHRIIRQNLFWAFFYNSIGILLAAGGLLSPIFAAGAMVLSSLIVLFNSQRVSGGGGLALTDPGG